MEDLSVIGKRLKRFMQEHGLTNSQFAEQAGLNPSIISHILSGRNKASLQVVLQAAKAFPDLDLDELLLGRPKRGSTKMTDPREGENSRSTPVKPEVPSLEERTKTLEAPTKSTVMAPSPSTEKRLERVILLYSDKSMDSYTP